MPDQPNDRTSSGTPHSPAIQRLAERYGMTPETIEQILSGVAAQPAAAAVTPVPPSSSQPEVTSPPIAPIVVNKDSVAEPTVAPTKSATKPRPPSGPGLTIAVLVVLLIALGAALSFQKGCFSQRGPDDWPKPNIADTLQKQDSAVTQQASQPPIEPSNVQPPAVPPEALVVPREAPKGTTGPPSTAGATTMKQAVRQSKKITSRPATPKPVLTTSSSLEAEERLAELHAAGFSKAHIARNGSGEGRTYSVYSR